MKKGDFERGRSVVFGCVQVNLWANCCMYCCVTDTILPNSRFTSYFFKKSCIFAELKQRIMNGGHLYNLLMVIIPRWMQAMGGEMCSFSFHSANIYNGYDKTQY